MDLLKSLDFLKVMAEENRLKIISILIDGEKCVCDIWKNLSIPQNLASHHLKILADYRLVNFRKEGLWVHYSLNKKNLIKNISLLDDFKKLLGKKEE
ncbi:MAG: metalloregulator ArsR/SmtB family transcription factor [Actinobacteria bacterium]|nr:metalloregulator ArsR/SmtB family transcription factor [Actinomycetota bacterium]